MIKAFKYRLYPNKEQSEKLQWILDRCRNLYNAALQERRDAWSKAKYLISVLDSKRDADEIKAIKARYEANYYTQRPQLTDFRNGDAEYQEIYAKILHDVLMRVEKSFKAFFTRCKRGDTPGYPRFQGKNRYDSFCYSQGGFSLTADNRLCLSKIGSIKVKLHRPIEGKMKTCTIKREGNEWYVVFSCEVFEHLADASKPIDHFPASSKIVGIDLGLLHFATLSTGETIENPRYYRKAEKKLEKHQQSLARKRRGSHRREKAKKLVAKAHRKTARQRKDFLHKESRKLVDQHDVIVFEDLQSANLSKRPKPKQDEETGQYVPNGASAKAGLNKSINDAGWAMFVQYCAYKAEWADKRVLTVNPQFTSQICSACGEKGPHKDLAERTHICQHCGVVLDRDHNAALNILKRGQRLQEQSCEVPVGSP